MNKIPNRSREAAWAKPVKRLSTSKITIPESAVNLNVEGNQLTGPLRGFGQMWQKTFRVRLAGTAATPAEVIATWKANFQQFWPKGMRFYGSMTGIVPGEVAVLNLGIPGNDNAAMVLSTGVMVIYADDTSFTFMTPEGHPIAGWITFSAHDEDGYTVVQAQSLIRAYDPLFELADRLGADKVNDAFWSHTVKAVATHFGTDAVVELHKVCIDPRVQWSEARNIWHNAGIRTGLYYLTAPLRWIRRKEAIR